MRLISAALKTRPCHHCQGTGVELDQFAVGQELRKLREKADLSLRFIAEYLGITPAFLSDLELGRRNWSEDRINAFKRCVEREAK